MTLRRQQSIGIESSDGSRLIAREFDEMRRPRPPVGQRPTKPRVIAEARRHVFVARVPHVRRHRERWALERELDFQFEAKGIDLKTRLVGPQSEGRAGGSGIYDVEEIAPREAVPGEMIDRRTQAIAAAGERSYDGKQERRPPGPDGRVAVPQQIAPGAIPQSG